MNLPAALITIDIREHELIALCQEKQVTFTTASLEVGDIKIESADQTLVFERKTMSDLVASIKDGRFKEQKQRLKSVYPFHRITYVIEGDTRVLSRSNSIHHIPTKAVISSLISSRYRDGFHVVHTADVTETLWYLQEVAGRMGEKTALQTEVKEDYVASLKVKSKKMDNITPEVCYLLQLSQFPGLSMTTAQEIAKIYPSMSRLLKAIHDNGEKSLLEIKGMGPKRAAMVVTYLQ